MYITTVKYRRRGDPWPRCTDRPPPIRTGPPEAGHLGRRPRRSADVPADVVERAKHLLLDGLGCALVGAQLPWSRIADRRRPRPRGRRATRSSSAPAAPPARPPPPCSTARSSRASSSTTSIRSPRCTAARCSSRRCCRPRQHGRSRPAAPTSCSPRSPASRSGPRVGLHAARRADARPRLAFGIGLRHPRRGDGRRQAARPAARAAGGRARAGRHPVGGADGRPVRGDEQAHASRLRRPQRLLRGRAGGGRIHRHQAGVRTRLRRIPQRFRRGPRPRRVAADRPARASAGRPRAIMVKSYAAMGGLHGAIDAARRIRRSRCDPRTSRTIDITVGETVYKHGWWTPERPLTPIGAQMNIGYATAAALLDGNVLPEQFTAARLDADDVWAPDRRPPTCTSTNRWPARPSAERFRTDARRHHDRRRRARSPRRCSRTALPPIRSPTTSSSRSSTRSPTASPAASRADGDRAGRPRARRPRRHRRPDRPARRARRGRAGLKETAMATTPARQRLRDAARRAANSSSRQAFSTASPRSWPSAPVTSRRIMTGAGVAASGFGLPDIGLVTATEMAERARMIVDALGDVPLIADADTGYGAPLNVVRTVRAVRGGRRRRNPAGGPGVPEEVRAPAGQAGRRRARCSSRRSPPRWTPAPTTTCSWSPAPTPGPRSGWTPRSSGPTAYAAAGADVIFVEAPQGTDEIERIATRSRRSAADQPGARRHDAASSRRRGCRSWVTRSRSTRAIRWRSATFAHAARACASSTARDLADLLPDQARRLLQPGRPGRVARTRHQATHRGRTTMGMTIIEKILARKAGSTRSRRVTPSSSTST